MTTRKPDDARGNFVALAAEAPGAVPGYLTREEPDEDFPTRPRWTDPETPDQAARATFLAAANDAPGAVIGAFSACRCHRSIRPGFILWVRDCPRHGTRIPRGRANWGARIREAGK